LLLWTLSVTSCGTGPPCRSIANLGYSSSFEPVVVHPYPQRIEDARRPLAVMGDTQRTSVFECLIGREVNDREQLALMGALSRDAPGALVMVGDMVFDGSSAAHWTHFDDVLAPIRRLNIPVLAVMGNHDYWLSTRRGRAHAGARFPRLRDKTWYHERYGKLGLIFLDSNRSKIEADWQAQAAWFRDVLAAFDADPQTRGVLVFAHHPPYTRSPIVPGDLDVREVFVKPILASPKTLGLVSGHAHGYERYLREGKHFIVSGGGGGPRPRTLVSANKAGLDDQYAGPTPRPFNYLLIEEGDAGVRVRVRGLDKGEEEIRDLESFDIAFAGEGAL